MLLNLKKFFVWKVPWGCSFKRGNHDFLNSTQYYWVSTFKSDNLQIDFICKSAWGESCCMQPHAYRLQIQSNREHSPVSITLSSSDSPQALHKLSSYYTRDKQQSAPIDWRISIATVAKFEIKTERLAYRKRSNYAIKTLSDKPINSITRIPIWIGIFYVIQKKNQNFF